MSKEDGIITVADLVDQTNVPPHIPRPVLRCMQCGHEVLSNKSVYLNSLDTREFICMNCNEPMKLVLKEVHYIELTPETWQKAQHKRRIEDAFREGWEEGWNSCRLKAKNEAYSSTYSAEEFDPDWDSSQTKRKLDEEQ